jgi:hypothetical protein
MGAAMLLEASAMVSPGPPERTYTDWSTLPYRTLYTRHDIDRPETVWSVYTTPSTTALSEDSDVRDWRTHRHIPNHINHKHSF